MGVSLPASGPRRRLAWAVPAAALVIVTAAVTLPMVATATPSLPAKSAATLLADVAASAGTPVSGRVTFTADLGLPALPQRAGTAIEPTALLSGSHRARVWSDGADRVRVAVVDDLAETDLVRNGRDVWLWTSGKNTVAHLRLPAATGTAAPPVGATPEGLTPVQAARQALAAVDPSTRVTVDGTATVAGRAAYELVLSPRDTRSLVGDVRIAVDSATSVPLRVQVHAAGSSAGPAFETAFTSVSFSPPDAAVFRFSPPTGATVTEPSRRPARHGEQQRTPGGDGAPVPTVVGSGWTAVLEMSGVTLPAVGGDGADGADGADGTSGGSQLSALRAAMTPVSGPYGSGHVLRTRLVSVLLLEDGRLLVGAVPPALLEQAAAR